MKNSTIYPEPQFEKESAVWDNLRDVITNSSGFQQWQQEKIDDELIKTKNLDQQITCYLRETLETLAY